MTLQMPGYVPRPTFGTAVKRGMHGRCPRCGRGALFYAYLKRVEACGECGEDFRHIRTDDAAPWLTILVVGHLLIPIVLIAAATSAMPEWLSMALWPSVALVLSLYILPRAKGVFVGAIWQTGATGTEEG